MKKSALLYLPLFALIFSPSFTKVLIWDLGYTLVKPSHYSVFNAIGYLDCMRLYVTHGFSTRSLINDTMMDLLSSGNEEYAPCVPCDPEGRIMPDSMCDWLKGTYTNSFILQKALRKSGSYPEFQSPLHQRVVEKIVCWMLDPQEFAKSIKPITTGVRLLRKCAQAKLPDGSPAHTLYIISNWDADSFKYVYKDKANHCVFRYFKPEHIYISGLIGYIKPDPQFFKYFLERENLNPSDCVLIDDQTENRRAAEACGMASVPVQNGNYKIAYQKLKHLKVIK